MTTFIEQGPGNTLMAMGKRTLSQRTLSWIASLDKVSRIKREWGISPRRWRGLTWRAEPGLGKLLRACCGEPVRVGGHAAARYPFQRSCFWLEQGSSSICVIKEVAGRAFPLGESRFSPRLMPGEMQFECVLYPQSAHFVPEYTTGRCRPYACPCTC